MDTPTKDQLPEDLFNARRLTDEDKNQLRQKMKEKIKKNKNGAILYTHNEAMLLSEMESLEKQIQQQKATIERQSKLLEKASWLVGNPGTNISSSTDIACDNWHKEYTSMKSQQTQDNGK